MKTPIHDFLERYANSGIVRMHMPGDKGRVYPFDITEITGADELYDCNGIIRESEQNAARLFGAAETCYSCGGATLAIQAMISTALAVTGKRKIVAGRYSHRSLVDTAILLGADIKWIYPDEFLDCDISANAVEAAIDENTAAVFINSVDYLGGRADIGALAKACHAKGVLLLTDNAHGAYRVFTGDHSLALGADMSADSAHKTLPAITGTAYLHLADSAYYKPAKSAMALFGSSSPSYLMLDSLDLCNRFIAEKRQTALDTLDKIAAFKRELTSHYIPLCDSDQIRVTIDANTMGYTGHGLAQLIRKHGVECEMGGLGYAVMLFSVSQPEEDFARLSEVFRGILRFDPIEREEMLVIKPENAMSLREAYFSKKETVSVKDSVGRICADICSPCPPCVPIVMPGEVISETAAEMLTNYDVGEIAVTLL